MAGPLVRRRRRRQRRSRAPPPLLRHNDRRLRDPGLEPATPIGEPMPATTTANGTRRPPNSTIPPLPATPADTAARRNRSRAAAGALVLTVCTLGAVLIFGRVGDRQAVLAMARTVEVGQIVQIGDLRVVHVSADPGVHPVPAAHRSQIVGRPAAVRLLSGTMLSKSQVG